MINQQTEERASLYVLDLLEGEDRVLFEKELKESAELQQLVNELSAALYDPLMKVRTPVRPDLLEKVVRKISVKDDTVVSSTKSDPAPVPWTYIWAVAALILLGMNLLLLFLVRDQAAIRPDDLVAGGERDYTDPAGEISGELGLSEEERTILEARIARLEQDLASSEENADLYLSELEKAGERESEVSRYNAEWQQEYARLAARILPFFEPNDGLGRFTVIEMVDSEAFANDLPRRGFADLAGRFLTGEGNIAGVGTEEFVGPVVEGAGILSATADPTQPGLTPIARGTPTVMADSPALPDTAMGPEAPQAAVLNEEPTGFTVWRDDEQKGFLDLYNLPELDEGQEAYLWVRSSELDPYVPVGVVPQLDNGTGSIFYSVDEPNFTPTEILITSEEAGAAGSEPGNTVILRGP
ncbi:anti-sigma factor [Puniceicoccales bacterium CK1056]|uniref:Anti-sigma factor n=1 Tax=Oceanipulchritudo coccoides TaxID=2706888 RepID=A0A6B2M3M7_9BACT|nr:anti-sigma factor [Oceanipulchritudo coccoides]NDV62687.1 anti-sigma factor [Oceanipulchritudo coccoides]